MRSYSPGHELRASLVRHPQLVEALQWLFEAVWDTSVPIITSFFSENDPRRQMLISLLMTGSTDNAIATQLGINVRSVRRWISELMDELGVTTRLQLGAALVRAETCAPPRQPRRQCVAQRCSAQLPATEDKAPKKPRPRSRGRNRGRRPGGGDPRGTSGKVPHGSWCDCRSQRTAHPGNVRYPGFLTEVLRLGPPDRACAQTNC